MNFTESVTPIGTLLDSSTCAEGVVVEDFFSSVLVLEVGDTLRDCLKIGEDVNFKKLVSPVSILVGVVTLDPFNDVKVEEPFALVLLLVDSSAELVLLGFATAVDTTALVWAISLLEDSVL